jgi:DNA-binding beta-propeller fold protein YncE
MKKRRLCLPIFGAIALSVGSLVCTVPASQAAKDTAKFIATDEPGPWFKCVGDYGCVNAGSQSLAVIAPGDIVQINNGSGTTNAGIDTTNTVHTFTSLLYPTGAKNMPFDQPQGAFRGTKEVGLVTPGLYVFVCKLHPFMLAAAIVDDSKTVGLDLGDAVTLISYNQTVSIPTSSDLATRLLRTFFLITNQNNYQDHNLDTNPSQTWHIAYPENVSVRITGGAVVDLKTVLEARYGNDLPLASLSKPATPGVGEIWVDAEFEKTKMKTKPGTAIAVDANTWKVTKRVALPSINMNNPHNMWTNRDQTVIYQTQWFGNELSVFNRVSGSLIRNITVGHAPAHVMTRVDTDQVHVSLNGEDAVIELNSSIDGNSFSRRIPTQFPGDLPGQPHAHWMSSDGKTMVTPNSNTNDSTRIDLIPGTIASKEHTGTLPIASSIMPDASKYYVSNYLDSTITCLSINGPECVDGENKVAKKDINLLLGGTALANYNPFSTNAVYPDDPTGFKTSAGLPIQTPVSPDGRFVITANTLTGTISIIDTKTDTLIAILPCSAGCHGVNFGAKKGGGYYAYVSSKFSNDLIIVDYDPNNDGTIANNEAMIAGRVLLVGGPGTKADDSVSAYAGMGGQGVLPIPLVYNGWVQNLPNFWKAQLTDDQKKPFPTAQ